MLSFISIFQELSEEFSPDGTVEAIELSENECILSFTFDDEEEPHSVCHLSESKFSDIRFIKISKFNGKLETIYVSPVISAVLSVCVGLVCR